MVKEGSFIDGNDLSIGADILRNLALDPAFAGASGRYYDNDAGALGPPHAAALDPAHVRHVMQTIQQALESR